MKRLFILFLCILPCAAGATKLANCDSKSYDVTIVNGGQTHVATLAPMGSGIEEFGPTVSFQIHGQRPVIVTNQYDEYCIWSGKITIQRRNTGNEPNGGSGIR